PRIEQRHVWRQRAEACIQVIEARIHQLQRKDLSLDPLADPLVTAHIAAEPVSREQRLAAKKCVTGAFKIVAFGNVHDFESPLASPAIKVRRLPLSHAVAEPRADE